MAENSFPNHSRYAKHKCAESDIGDPSKNPESFISRVLSSLVCTTDAVAAVSE